MEWSVRLPHHRCHGIFGFASWMMLWSWISSSYDDSDIFWSGKTNDEANGYGKKHVHLWSGVNSAILHQEKEASPNKAWQGHQFQLFALMYQRLPVEQWRKTLVDWLCVDTYMGLNNLFYWDLIRPNKSMMDNKPGCMTNWISEIYIYGTNSIATQPGTGQDSG